MTPPRLLSRNVFSREGLIAWLMVVAMVLVSDLTHQTEIIFPEIAALVIGGWIAAEQPWEVNRIKQILIMALSAFSGIAIVRFLPLPLFAQILIAFTWAVILLILFRCTFLPVISACVLPVLLRVESLVYPLSVVVMILIIAGVQLIMERCGIRKKRIHCPCCYVPRETFRHYALLLAALAITAAFALLTGATFMIAPPLLVAMAELAEPNSPARPKATKIFAVVTSCAFIGAWGRLILSVSLALPAVVTAAVVMFLVLILLGRTQIFFPPAGAIAILPFIIPAESLLVYPFQIAAGFFVLAIAAMLIGGKE
jgi:hypothetical protein